MPASPTHWNYIFHFSLKDVQSQCLCELPVQQQARMISLDPAVKAGAAGRNTCNCGRLPIGNRPSCGGEVQPLRMAIPGAGAEG